MQPGLCEGSIILARQGSEDTQVDIRVGTWIKRGANFLTIEDLQIGDQSKPRPSACQAKRLHARLFSNLSDRNAAISYVARSVFV